MFSYVESAEMVRQCFSLGAGALTVGLPLKFRTPFEKLTLKGVSWTLS